LTLIAFVGSVFSPYYAAARRWGAGDPLNHCALNVALYSTKGKRWALTERTRRDLRRTAATLAIGPSALSWDGVALDVSIDEWAFPLIARIKGRVRVTPAALIDAATALDEAGRHGWTPIAPRARIDVDLEFPAQRWTGDAYLDHNFGSEPLERAFRSWTWSRAHTRDGTLLLYDVERRDGSRLSLAQRIEVSGRIYDFPAPPPAPLPHTFWQVARTTRCDAGATARVARTLEDTPFYARSLIDSTISGTRVRAIHEALSLDRVAHPLVRLMLPFRMPRRRGRTISHERG
jgi:carotenoid 1,2-hydratase